ncbi:MAG: hypothetical protein ACI4QI_03880 [Candidatus Coproplasma sp.]
MKVCAITQRKGGFALPIPQCDIAVFGFSALGGVDFSEEINGKSSKLQTMAACSAKCGCAILCGCITDSRGLKRKSVAVASDGRLLGITDMRFVFDDENYKSGAAVGIYNLHGYKAGVCIDNDLLFPEHIKTLSECGCNLVCVHCEDLSNHMAPQLIRSYAYVFGVPIVMVAENVAFFADITGVIATSNRPVSLFETDLKNCYKVVTSRKRGLSDTCGTDF